MAISRGATPTNIFNVSVDLTSAEVLYVTYVQFGRTVLEKTIEECTVTSDTVTVSLSQNDTIKFKMAPVKIQIRARLQDGSAHVSKVIETTATELLKQGVI